jgi:hypothetical protein
MYANNNKIAATIMRIKINKKVRVYFVCLCRQYIVRLLQIGAH